MDRGVSRIICINSLFSYPRKRDRATTIIICIKREVKNFFNSEKLALKRYPVKETPYKKISNTVVIKKLAPSGSLKESNIHLVRPTAVKISIMK